MLLLFVHEPLQTECVFQLHRNESAGVIECSISSGQTIYDKYSGSMKITLRLDHISHC